MRNRPCSVSEHGRIKASPDRWQSEMENHRPWAEAGLEIAEHHCGSTLGLEVEEVGDAG